ncbi:hypothetical protein [Paenibacillus sp. XY044]|uniref:hypothetical protein n=1 Tax=Paenibacillus sp. XY044 TaxID=2026089 RepID=UPI000B98D79B|nr:hypothetical protein [Paenibacillus sp. XY044]OZB98055.1 hypothetical protein CJP46_02495 [Paenibacillus sp. XY044]
MNPLFKKVIKILKAHDIEFTVEGSTILTALCSIEIGMNEVKVNDKPVNIDGLWITIAAIEGR